MTKEELKEKFDEAAVKIAPNCTYACGEPFLIKIYIEMFKEYPNLFSLASEGFYLNKDVDDDAFEPDKIYIFDKILLQETFCNIIEAYKDTAIVYREYRYPVIIADHQIIFYDDNDCVIAVLQKEQTLSDAFKTLVKEQKNNSENWFHYVTLDNRGFRKTKLACKKQNVDLKLNYNDDIPNHKIENFIQNGESGLLLLYGEPGTGKTTYIRHLMYKFSDKQFLVMDASVLAHITDTSFITFLLDNKNSIIVLEDCEALLADRVSNGNKFLTTLLNLSDGIIGDSLNFKFICTFNAEIGKLDKAIQRKGRMKVKYEFKKLAPEKTHALGKKLGFDIPEGESLPLSDIFNYNEDNGKENGRKKIGFCEK